MQGEGGTVSKTIRIYLLTLLVFLALDAVWLGLVAPAFYRAHIGFLLADSNEFSMERRVMQVA